MKTIKKSMLLFLLVLLGSYANASVLNCTGKDNTGGPLNIVYNSDPQNQTLTVNGEAHKIQAPTKDKSGVATANFTSGNNEIVYDSFLNYDGEYWLHRFNAMTEDTVFNVKVDCKKG